MAEKKEKLSAELVAVLAAYKEVDKTLDHKELFYKLLGEEKVTELLIALLRADLMHLSDALNIWYQNGMKMLEDEEKCDAEH